MGELVSRQVNWELYFFKCPEKWLDHKCCAEALKDYSQLSL